MSTLAATVSLDVRMQARSKLYSIGITVAALLTEQRRLAVAGLAEAELRADLARREARRA